jgi:5'-nucleotidase/5'-nucleotidase/UDP-sugar diphosphatase
LGHKLLQFVWHGDVALAESLPFVCRGELIIGAHTHDALNEGGLELNNVVNGIPIVQAGYGGRYLGEVDIVIRDQPTVADVHLNFTAEDAVDEEFETKYVFSLFEKIRPIFGRKLEPVEDTCGITSDACCDDCAFNESALLISSPIQWSRAVVLRGMRWILRY